MYSSLLSPLPLARWYVEQVIQEGDHAVDGTAGNGYDTAFLAALVGECGKVYAFDIQQSAIAETQKRLKNCGMENRVQYILDSHQKIRQYVSETIRAAMFNLGYLPGGDHQITTHADEIIAALEDTTKLLLPGGLITVVVYPGHPAGKREEREVSAFANDLNKTEYAVMTGTFLKKSADPPKLITIQKGICKDE